MAVEVYYHFVPGRWLHVARQGDSAELKGTTELVTVIAAKAAIQKGDLGRVDKIEIFVILAKDGIYEDLSLGHYWTQNAWIPVQDRNDGVFVHTP